jgi:hypothetical protein
LSLDGNAPFPLELHVIEKLSLHFSGSHGAGPFQKAVSKGGFPMINMGDDTEISNIF